MAKVETGNFMAPSSRRPLPTSSSYQTYQTGMPKQDRRDSRFLTPNERKKKYTFPPKFPKYTIMDPVTYQIKLKYCEIRPNKTLNLKSRAETPWSADLGLFKRYLKENNKKQLSKCFETDWEYMKDIAKKYKISEEADVKAEMFTIYKYIKEIYKDQAGYNPSGHVFCIGQNQLEILMN